MSLLTVGVALQIGDAGNERKRKEKERKKCKNLFFPFLLFLADWNENIRFFFFKGNKIWSQFCCHNEGAVILSIVTANRKGILWLEISAKGTILTRGIILSGFLDVVCMRLLLCEVCHWNGDYYPLGSYKSWQSDEVPIPIRFCHAIVQKYVSFCMLNFRKFSFLALRIKNFNIVITDNDYFYFSH